MGRVKKVKLETIAKEVGVSVTAVSFALTGKKGVGEEKRQQILEAAERLGYQVREKRDTENVKSSPQEKKRNFLVRVFVAERYIQDTPSFYMKLYEYLANETIRSGIFATLSIVSTEEESGQKEDVMEEPSCDGIFVIGELSPSFLKRKMASLGNPPVVFLDYYDVKEDADYIVTDGFRGMEEMTRLLLDQGIFDLAFIGNIHATKNIMDRYLGCCKALVRVGRDPDTLRIIPDRTDDGRLISISLPDPCPKGLVCNCDRSALKAMRILKERGLRVPEDVSVVGFDNFPIQTEGPRLSTYKNDGSVIARIAVRTLIRRMEEKKPPMGVRFVEGSIIRGETVRYRRHTDGQR